MEGVTSFQEKDLLLQTGNPVHAAFLPIFFQLIRQTMRSWLFVRKGGFVLARSALLSPPKSKLVDPHIKPDQR